MVAVRGCSCLVPELYGCDERGNYLIPKLYGYGDGGNYGPLVAWVRGGGGG